MVPRMIAIVIIIIYLGTVINCQDSGCGTPKYQSGTSGGSFSSMNYPNKYNSSARCEWRITVPDRYRIRLNFIAFSLEQRHDTVTIYDGSLTSVSYGPYSGHILPPDILSYDNDVTVSFRSDSSVEHTGFNITWTAISRGRKTFGYNRYTCHCKLNVQCDSSGACPYRECDQGWYGEYCQIGNAALGRPATQSSTYRRNTAAEKAVDNDRNQLISGRSCTLTAEQPLDNQPWWRVDLGETFVLLNLTIYNRGNDGCQSSISCRDRLKNFVVWMADIDDPDPAKRNVCVTHPGVIPLGAQQRLTCDSPAVGRYLYIKLLDSRTALSLCEVVVHAFQYRESECGTPMYQVGLSGNFSIVNYTKGHSYHRSGNCEWRITAPVGYQIHLHFTVFDLDIFDTFEIYDGSSTNVSYGHFIWFIVPPDILSYDNAVRVLFRSYDPDELARFHLIWTAVAKDRKTFGPTSDFTCHCKLNVQCDSSGACPNRKCDQGWYGEYCQAGNAALGRPATQSSTYGMNTGADKAVDNERSQEITGGRCTLTAEHPLDNQPWWRVDLGETFVLLNLTIYNRGNDGCQNSSSCRDRLKNFVIWMAGKDDSDQTKGDVCVSHPRVVPLGAQQQLTCDSPSVGRYLYIKLLDNRTALSLCEVVVNAFPYRDSGCGTPMYHTGTSGYFSSMNYPNKYTRNANCEWRIFAPVGYRIRLHFNENFSVLGGIGCGRAGVKFVQQGNKYAGPYCDTSAPPPDFFTLYNYITVKFTTSSQSTPQTGFAISWSIFSAIMESGCGGPMYLFGQSGSISSMNYPNFYQAWASCHWVITAPLGTSVKLQFNSTFGLEGCHKDYVKTSESGRICGTSAPGDLLSRYWPYNEATVSFFSDGANQRAGFSLTWTAVAVNQSRCGNSIQTGSNGSFSSMNYPRKYDKKANCVWRITVANGYRIRLHFSQPFAIDDYDSLSIDEESLASAYYRGSYRGLSPVPPDFLSYDNDVTVSFRGYVFGSPEQAGFHITWIAIAEDRKTFGPTSDFTCHCKLNVQCDSSGACPNQECDQGWYGDYCETGNAALGRPATQSSTYGANTGAEKAVDNNRNQLMSGGSCTLTADPPLDDQPWWRVDLGERFVLLNLTIYNRRELHMYRYLYMHDGCRDYASCRDRLKNFVVWMTDLDDPDPTKGDICVTHPEVVRLDDVLQLTCHSLAIGRYLYIKLLDERTALTLCEVAIHAFQVLGSPNSLEIVDATVKSLKIRWTRPRFVVGRLIKAYKLSCIPLFSYDDAVNDNKDKYIIVSEPAADSKEANLEGMQQATKYNCSISAHTSIGYGPAVSVQNWTRPERDEVPAEWISSITVKAWSAKTITLDIKEVPQNVLRSGEIKAIRVGVKITSAKSLHGRRKRATALTGNKSEQLTGFEEAKAKGDTSYVAAELAANFTGLFVIGDGTTHGGYQNPPLVSGETYDVLYGVVIAAGWFTSVWFGQLDESIKVDVPNTGVAIGVAVGIPIAVLVVLAAVIVPIVVIRRRKRERSDQNVYEQTIRMEETTQVTDPDANIYAELRHQKPDEPIYMNVGRHAHQPSHAGAERGEASVVHHEAMAYDNTNFDLSEHAMFVDQLAQLIMDKNLLREFKDIPTLDQRMPMSIGGQGHRKATEITPFEFNRIQIHVGEEIKDINASHIQVFDSKAEFIATKDPSPEEQNDMWEMIWQNQCTAVVMLTTPAEDKDKRRCYWPSEGMKAYGDIQVTLIDKEEIQGCAVRTFKVDKKEQRQIVLQLQILEWPDTTRKIDVILGILKRVSRHFEAGPLLVHCCDGSDRTGTLIALHQLIEQGEATRYVCVVDCIKKLREQRMLMVKSLTNYKLIHDALVEHFLVRSAAPRIIKRSDFVELFAKLKADSKLEQLSQLLCYYDPPKSPNTTDTARININKNRDKAILPDDRHRVKLTSKCAKGNDYINAVFVQGYNDQRYILTQMPLPDTVNDFWRLVHDGNVTTIVMLNQVDRKDKTCAVYWQPTSDLQKYEQFTVECTKESADDPDINVRDFKVCSKLSKKETNVRQFQPLAWGDTPLPPKPSVILKLTGKVDKWASGSSQGTILVQCMNGATRSGLFCVAHAAISQVRLADEVDIFDLARKARAVRPQILQESSQYEFVHEVVAKYVKSPV